MKQPRGTGAGPQCALLVSALVLALPRPSANPPTGRVESIQPDSIVIVVRMSSGEAMIGARVELETPHVELRKVISTHSDEMGRAVLPIPPDSGWVRVSSFGFITQRLRITSNVTGVLEVGLAPDTTRLPQVCTTSWDPAITLVPDTTVPLDTTAVTIRVVDDAYVEERVVRLDDFRQRFYFAYERPGRYDITASAAGGSAAPERAGSRVLPGRAWNRASATGSGIMSARDSARHGAIHQ